MQKRKVTYPGSTNSNVQEEEEWLGGQGLPNSKVVDASSGELVVQLTVHVPVDALVDPVAIAAVNLESPVVPILVRDANGGTETGSLIADTAGVLVAVGGAIAGQTTVNSLHNIELTAGGPGGAVADGVTQRPPRGPDTLLVVGAVATEAQLGFDTGDLAWLGGPDVVGLETARSPAAANTVVAPWDDLEGIASAELDVTAAGGVGLELAIDVALAVDDVPVSLVGGRAATAGEAVGPDEGIAAVLGRSPGGDRRREGDEGDERVGEHFVG